MPAARPETVADDRPLGASGVQEADSTLEGAPGGARARSRRLVTGIVTAAASRAAGLLVPLLLIPVTLSYLGPDRYGLWMAVIALTGMAAFADLGLGNGLMTKLAPCYASGDTDRARRYLSSTYALLGAISLTLCALLWLCVGLVPWSSVFNVADTASPSETRVMVLIWLTAFVVNVPLALINRVQYAYQQIGASYIWQGAGNVVTLPLVLLAVHADLPPVAVVAATAVGPPLVNAVNSLWVYGHRMPQLRPRLDAVDRGLAWTLLRLSGVFFVLTIVMSLANNADNLIIAHALGVQSVTEYAVPAKLMSQLGVLVYLVNLPLWPANGEALARGDLAWVRRTVRRMTAISLLVTALPSALLVLAGGRVFAAWLPIPLGGDRWLLAGLALWWVLLASFSPFLMVQNAAGVLRPQLVGLVLYLGVSVVAKWYGAKAYGLAAVPFIGFFAYGLTVLPAALHGYRRTLARYEVDTPGRHRR
ncbi:oligosaccharide flippase family protein [Micromonospora sp. ATA32]|nr:oligosaccharide flippase family protein [Micromonospora sp. ATA32]